MIARRGPVTIALVLLMATFTVPARASDAPPAHADVQSALKRVGIQRGVCAVIGLPDADQPGFVTGLAAGSELVVYFQSADPGEVRAVREAAEKAGLLGTRVFADRGDPKTIHLADNLVGAVCVAPSLHKVVAEDELRRVLHPGGKAILGEKEFSKPFPEGIDTWSHPYHGPDNNPQSTDRIARAPYLTQFIAAPKFSPMPQVTVAAGGRVFKAFGHISHKANQNAVLNTLLCINAYNGIVLWKRPLREGFMIHRNTMIATPEVLYLADDEACRLIDPLTGKETGRIVVPEGVGDGTVWKWMALEGGVLYALVGSKEIQPKTIRGNRPGIGHWPWGMWEGHDYKDPKTNFGFGRTFIAVDLKANKVLWHHDEEQYVDSRGVCMRNGRIYFYSPGKSLNCLDLSNKSVVWKNTDADLLQAIGPQGRAQHYVTGYATTTYIKCNDKLILFAGPQRSKLVAAGTKDGKLVWQQPDGNRQLVLRENALYSAGARQTGSGVLSYETGERITQLPGRRACTRATGSIDSVFYRASGGTVRVEVPSNTAKHIAPMRPPCQDGVIISDGQLYWGPWMCGCQLCLYGHIGLGPAGTAKPGRAPTMPEAGQGDPAVVKPLPIQSGDWPSYLGDSARSATTAVAIPAKVAQKWAFQPSTNGMATAPVAAGGLVFVGHHTGAVRALDAASGAERWKVYTGGAIYFPPAVMGGRVFVGSADGRVYAFEAGTGRPLWRFRVAPADRFIPVFGRLTSTWPVAGGVVVEKGVVYAAAGIAHYDGTIVCALDAVTGKPKWLNADAGSLSTTDNGVSLQGCLSIRNGELRFDGGNVHAVARFELATGKCLNKPSNRVGSSRSAAFYPYYPEYAQYMPLACTLPDKSTLSYPMVYDGSRKAWLARLKPYGADEAKFVRDRRGRKVPAPRKKVWQLKPTYKFNGFVIGTEAVVCAGQKYDADFKSGFLAAYSLKDGTRLWRHELPCAAVKGGAAIDAAQRLFVSLQDGRVLCFAPDSGS